MATLTGRNAVIMLGVAGLYDTPQQLQGFAADDVFDTDEIAIGETLIGVDGILSGGFVLEKTTQRIRLQSDSDSIDTFDQWIQAMLAQQDTLPCNGIIRVPGLGIKWTLPKGFLVKYPPMVTIKKLVGPRTYTIDWETAIPSPL